MRIILTALISTMTISLFSQISIEKTDFLLVNDTARISVTTDENIDFSTTGANSFWDYSNLIAESQQLLSPTPVTAGSFAVQFQFGPMAPMTYASDYYESFTELPFEAIEGFLPVNFEDYFRFTKITDDSVTFPGYAFKVEGNDVPFRSDTIEIPYRFPLEYGDTYASRAYSKIDFNPFFNGIFIQYRQRSTTVDGHGTLITPFGTFDALRVTHTIDEQDSIYVDLFGFAQWIPINQPRVFEYEWWAKNQKVPVLKITAAETMGDQTVTDITYRDEYLGLDASLAEEQMIFELYPNPAENILHIESNRAINKIMIYNEMGALLYESSSPHHIQTSIDVNHFANGTYFIHLHSDHERVIRKFIIQR
jgi:hypothetical protein